MTTVRVADSPRAHELADATTEAPVVEHFEVGMRLRASEVSEPSGQGQGQGPG